MGHVESAHLVELALGNSSGDEDAGALRHIAGCPFCREELKSLTRLVSAARDAEVVDLPTAPPAHVWQRIAEEVSREARTPPHPRRHRAVRPAGGATGGDRLTRPAGVVGRGGFAARVLAAGAAAAVAVLLVVRRRSARTGRGPLGESGRRFGNRARTAHRTRPDRRRR
ncbi:hypothetical protein ACFQ9U_01535 [Streptomyces sp. NPDC056568]|uniref:hypothetical protein n=1 Tax=Streptomyces sp. NPDC056568 TaxID=3345866 RepID=UPI0036BFD974